MADLEVEFEDDDEEEEEEETERPVRYRRSESIFSITKEDLILLMLFLFGGVFVGWYANKLLNKKEMHPYPYSFPFMHHSTIEPSPVVEEKERPPGISTTREKRQTMKRRRGGYYLDKEGNAVMESPSVQENWIIKRDFDGTIIDAYKIDESIR